MSRNLVIVESPAKAKTIAHYLGAGYTVKASVGHVRDLPPDALGVDIEQAFHPCYKLIEGKQKIVAEIRDAARSAERIYLATDPDREGEAIAWHVAVAADLDKNKTQRVTFYQVTKSAVQEAMNHPRAVDANLVDAQQARRVLDRLVGYQISPLLSKSLRKALSAGRVQSVALRLVVEREREILAFVPQEYWTLEAELKRRIGGREVFRARLHKIRGQDPELKTEADVQPLLVILEKAEYKVTRVQEGERQRKPQPPFVTSTLQAEAGRKLRFSPRQTMRLAQQLYEGIDLDGERVGLITYMRTDSTNIAPEAQQEARSYIAATYGAGYLPVQPPIYQTKAALAQEAHEAIRPTSVLRTPQTMRQYLDEQQAHLYELIWRRFLASQMKPALYATMTVDIVAARDYLFRATGSTLIFPGYLAVYTEGVDDAEEEQAQPLPPLTKGEIVDLLRLLPEQHFTQPPPRYTEPTLIKALEEKGVGRPSTYASIVTLIQDRGYVAKIEDRRLRPSALGMVVCDTLVATFEDIMDVRYTATMEERLDHIAGGQLSYESMLGDFYAGFRPELDSAKDAMPQAIERALWSGVSDDLRQRPCPQCGRPLQARLSEAGRFLGCTGYPQCRYTLDLGSADNPREQVSEYAEGEVCERCGGRMKVITRGRNRFLGCENYPRCKNTRSILSDQIKQLAAETRCPQCQGPLEPRRGRYGEYLSCPHCQVNYSLSSLGKGKAGGKRGRKEQGASLTPPAPPETVDVACPQCGHPSLEKRLGRYSPYYRCPGCKTNISLKKFAALPGAETSETSQDVDP